MGLKAFSVLFLILMMSPGVVWNTKELSCSSIFSTSKVLRSWHLNYISTLKVKDTKFKNICVTSEVKKGFWCFLRNSDLGTVWWPIWNSVKVKPKHYFHRFHFWANIYPQLTLVLRTTSKTDLKAGLFEIICTLVSNVCIIFKTAKLILLYFGTNLLE